MADFSVVHNKTISNGKNNRFHCIFYRSYFSNRIDKCPVENFQGEYVLTSYSEDPSSPGWRFIVKPDKTVKMKLLNENGEEYDSPWLPGYWETNTTILEGRTIYVITIGNDEFYLNLEDKYATMSEYDMKSKVPLLKIKKVK